MVINLIEFYMKKYNLGPIHAISHMMMRVRGTYALAIMIKDYPGKIFVARKDAPMVIGVGDGESYLASDVPAILKYTRTVYYIDNMEVGVLETDKITFYNIDQEEIEKTPTQVQMDAEAAETGTVLRSSTIRHLRR